MATVSKKSPCLHALVHFFTAVPPTTLPPRCRITCVWPLHAGSPLSAVFFRLAVYFSTDALTTRFSAECSLLF